jgi:outer membrane receptor for ferrienterochelin and colicins
MRLCVPATALVALMSAITCASFSAGAAEVAEMLDAVNVTATKSAMSTAESPASVSVISAEEIQAKGATDLFEAVRGLAGITMTGQGIAGRKTINIRGAESKHTLVLIDGKRVSATDDIAGHSDYQYEWLPMENVERIEVVRGPMSALYGSEALGGVINIITKQAGKKWTGNAVLRGDLNKQKGGDAGQFAATLSGPITDKFSASAAVESYHSAPVNLKENPRLSEIEGRDRNSISLNMAVKPWEDHEFSVNLLHTNEIRSRDNVSGTTYYHDRYDLKRTQRGVAYRGDWGPAKTELRYTDIEFDVKNRRDRGVAATRPQNLKDRILDGSVAFAVGSAQMLTIGGEHREEILTNAGLAGGQATAHYKSVYIQDEIALMKDLALTLGLRADNHDTFGTEYSPRAYLVWKATDELTIKGGYGEAFRAPTLKQISPTYVASEGPHTFYGNAAVKPETSQSWEIGFDWRRKGTSVTGALFHTDIKDLINTRLVSVSGIRRSYIYDNISQARIQGGELGARHELGGGFAASLNYTYLHATNEQTGQKLTERPTHSFSTTLDWADGPWSALTTAEYIGSQTIEDTTGMKTAPSYALWHASAGYQVNDNLKLRLGLRNITDVRLAEKSALFSYAEPGRTVYLALGASF